MSRLNNIIPFFLAIAALITFNACSGPGGDNPGSEYMPDMGHSVAFEPNVYNYYYLNTWDSASVMTLKELSMPRNPVEGTIARGYAGSVSKSNDNSAAITVNGSVPYYYENTEEDRARAINEIITNPFPITAEGLAKGKELYTIFCGICHGEKGDGNGWLYSEENANAKYPAAPANFLQDTFYNSSNGRYYHSIMYGKGVMGAYKDKLSFEERWQVIHYIHSLQAKEKKLEYSESANTYSSVTADVPGKTGKPVAQNQEVTGEVPESNMESDGSEINSNDDSPDPENSPQEDNQN